MRRDAPGDGVARCLLCGSTTLGSGVICFRQAGVEDAGVWCVCGVCVCVVCGCVCGVVCVCVRACAFHLGLLLAHY